LFAWVWVEGLFASFVLIYLFQALVVSCMARFFDCSECNFNLFIVLWDITHAVFLQLVVCKEPLHDGVEAQ
jgi:hypothetical protein